MKLIIHRFIVIASAICTLSIPFAGNCDVLTTAAEITSALKRLETNVRFSIEATVACVTHSACIITVTDNTGSTILLDYHEQIFNGIKVGDRIHASGSTICSKGSKLPVPHCDSIRVLGHSLAPTPTIISAQDFHSGKFDYAFVKLQGTVRDIFVDEIDANWTILEISAEQTTVSAAIFTKNGNIPDLSALIGGEVAIAGTCVKNRGGTRRKLRRQLFVPESDVLELLRSPPPDPFEAPDLSEINCATPSEIAMLGRHRTHGQVIVSWNQRNFIVKTDNGEIVLCDLKNGSLPKCGECVDVVGLPTTDLFRINLTRAIWRKSEKPFAMPTERAERITSEQLFTDENGKPGIQTRYHGHAITMSGIVRSMPADGSPECRMYLQCGRFTLPIDTSTARDCLKNIEIGCEIDATGILVTEMDSWNPIASFPRIRDVILLPRHNSDIRILRRPPWWTPKRLLIAISALISLLLGILGWNIALHHIAERRGRELAVEHIARAETDMKVMERTRLAVELHDSVAQNLTGVAMELETARQYQHGAHPELLNHLSIAWRTLKSCRNELRNSLWDLRSNALEESDMEAAIHKTLLPYVKGVNLTIRFKVPREMLTDNTAHTMLRIIRELVLNGIRHGGAKSIRIAGRMDEGSLMFSVKDDGCGFDPGNCPGMDEGHFGLQGIHERVRHLGGTMTVESSPGAGAKVTVSIGLKGE